MTQPFTNPIQRTIPGEVWGQAFSFRANQNPTAAMYMDMAAKVVANCRKLGAKNMIYWPSSEVPGWYRPFYDWPNSEKVFWPVALDFFGIVFTAGIRPGVLIHCDPYFPSAKFPGELYYLPADTYWPDDATAKAEVMKLFRKEITAVRGFFGDDDNYNVYWDSLPKFDDMVDFWTQFRAEFPRVRVLPELSRNMRTPPSYRASVARYVDMRIQPDPWTIRPDEQWPDALNAVAISDSVKALTPEQRQYVADHRQGDVILQNVSFEDKPAYVAILDILSRELVAAPIFTTTTLTSSENPSTAGKMVTFTAVVQADGQANSIPTGTVRFRVNGGWADMPLVAGTASIDFYLSPGNHTITAEYLPP